MLLLIKTFLMKHSHDNSIFTTFISLFKYCYAPYHSNIASEYQNILNPELHAMNERIKSFLSDFLIDRSSLCHPCSLFCFVFLSTAVAHTSNYFAALASYAQMLKDGVNLWIDTGLH